MDVEDWNALTEYLGFNLGDFSNWLKDEKGDDREANDRALRILRELSKTGNSGS